MNKSKSDIWLTQRIVLAMLSTTYITYCYLLEFLNILTLIFPLIVIPSILSPQKVCRSMRLPLINGIAINYCGFLIPLYSALALIIYCSIRLYYLILLVPLAIVIAVIHTYTTYRMILVNVIRYSLSFVLLSVVIISTDDVYHLLPFSTVIGIVLGSDIIPLIFMHKVLENGRMLVVGGYMALDSISISLLFSLVTLLMLRVLQLLGVFF